MAPEIAVVLFSAAGVAFVSPGRVLEHPRGAKHRRSDKARDALATAPIFWYDTHRTKTARDADNIRRDVRSEQDASAKVA